jgi:hypothetical protein
MIRLRLQEVLGSTYEAHKHQLQSGQLVLIPDRSRDFSLDHAPRLTLGPTQGLFTGEKSVKLITHLHPRMYGAIPPLMAWFLSNASRHMVSSESTTKQLYISVQLFFFE